jgi:hypothetical protein
LEDSKKSCCKEGVTVADGDRELGLKLKVEAGLGADVKGWIKGQNILGGSVKGPRASGTASLSMKNKNCGGPFDTAEICNTQVLFAGASADAKITAPTPESMKKFDSSTGLFSGADPIVKKLNIGAAVTVGLQGTLTNCAAFDFRNFSLKSTFCGESVITASVTFLDTGKSTWQPFQENFRKFCITLLDEAIPVPPILLP